MEFLFFSAADAVQFARDDAESADWTVEDMSLVAEFPYDAAKVLQRGQRVGFTDETGVFQPFEIRKVETMEPDHYQRITAEHIVISELSDEHCPGAQYTDVTAQAALTALLTGTLWSVGTVTASGTSSGDASMGSKWQAVRTIETNWNVYITPRVTFNASGITGRYLDIAPAAGTWRGVRLSIDKNADEMGVTYDDTNVITAMYGYGRNVNDAPLTFAESVWTATSDHPAKPSGQTYLEDTAATALYGRNGRPRWGYYQNGNISDPDVLLEKTWEALRITNAPRVTIDCMVRDLYRLGYDDQPIRLHDTALVEVEPTGEKFQLEIIRLRVDLLDPTATRPTIGAYIPNIIYISRETASRAGGGGGGGGRGQTNREKELSEFETEITANQYQISLRAYQRDMDNVDDILRQAGLSINAQGVLVYAEDVSGHPNYLGSKLSVQSDGISTLVTKTGINSLGQNETLYSEIVQNANSIALVVTNGGINAASIVAAINDSGSSVIIEADHIDLRGYVTANDLSAVSAEITNLTTGATTATTLRANAMYGDTVNTSGLWVHNGTAYVEAEWQSKSVITGVTLYGTRDWVYETSNGTQHKVTGYIVTDTSSSTIYYLGHT